MIHKAVWRVPVILGLLAICLALSTCLLCADQPYAFSFSDDFSKYRDGSDGFPTWETDSYLGWEVRDGAFIPLDNETSFALPKKAPYGRLAAVEATVMLRGTRSASWKIAGVLIHQDSRNYWHLALIESPDASGRSHHVELSEAYDGRWLAHAEKSTALTSVSSTGQNFDWKYNHPYRLRIELNPKGIVGTVRELDGTERARIGYRFDNKAVTWGKPGLDGAGFRVEFDDFSAKVGMEVSAQEVRKTAAFPPYSGKGWAGTKGKRTGFFHAERIDDKWWVIDPAGSAFYIIGTDHVNYNVHSCEKLGYAPYHRNCERIYGTEEKWADTNVARLRRWGFNSLGANSSPSTRHKRLAHMEFLGMGSSFSGVDYITEKTTWTGFPNVFSPDFERFCDRLARRHCAPLKDDPWVIGYFIDNELEWFGKSGSLFSDAFKRPADHSARIALVDLLRERYRNDVKAFNAAWKTDIAEFDDLLELTQAPRPATPEAESDVREYARLAAERYFAVSASAIRRHDPNHMVLGCRFAGAAPDVWDIAGKYCDIVSVNSYRTVDLEKGVLADGYEEDLAEWYRKTKRPLMITEWSFPALDTPLPSEHGAGQRVPTQKDRARAFTIFQKLLFATPFVVGSDFFMWVDEPALGISSTFPEDSNYGLVNENDKPYKLLTEAARKLHPLVYDIHSGNVADVYAKQGEKPGTLIVGNSGKSDASCTVSLWTDGRLAEQTLEIPGGGSRRIEAPQDSLAAPGGHFLVCRVDQKMAFAEPNEADNLATQHFYTPGLPAWDAASQYSRIPIIVTNSTDKAVRSVPISLKLCELALLDWSRAKDALCVVRAQDGRQSEIPFQVVADDEFLFALDELGPRECATVFVYLNSAARLKTQAKVTYRETGDGFEVDNGALKLLKRGPGGNAFDRIDLGSIEVGSFSPVIWQQVGQDFWVRPTGVERIEAHEGPVALVLDMTFLFDGGRAAAITEVGPEGKYAPAENRPHMYRTKYRFTIYPGKPYFDSRFLWVENTDEEPWHFHTYYHYIRSNIAGDSSDDKPKVKYWLDAAANLCYGVEAPDVFSVILWKDSTGLEHPDVYRYPYFSRTLKPGERLAAADPPVHTIAGSEDEFARAADELHALSDLHIQVCEMESPDIPAQRHHGRE